MKTANMTIKEILASNNNGQGKTDSIAQTSNIVGDTITFNNIDYTVRAELQAAKLLQYFSRETNPADVLETLQAGYLGKLHQKTLENESNKDKKPETKALNVLTADEYLQNCLKLAVLDNVSLFTELSKFSDKSTKAELLAFVEDLRGKLVTSEQVAVYETMREKEKSLDVLREKYRDFRQYVGAGGVPQYRAIISADDYRNGGKALLESNFKLILAQATKRDEFETPIEFDVTFRPFTEKENESK